MHRITRVTPGDGLILHLTYDDGTTIHADVSGLLDGEPGVFAPLVDRAFFARVTLAREGRVVTWPGELDLDADALRMSDDDPSKSPTLRVITRDKIVEQWRTRAKERLPQS